MALIDGMLRELEDEAVTTRRVLERVPELGGMDDGALTATWRLTNGERELFATTRAAMLRSVMLNHWYHHRGLVLT